MIEQEDLVERFRIKVVEKNGHLIWTGALRGRKNSRRGFMSIERKTVIATHVSWFLHTGEWPTQYVCHTRDCGIALCVKFEHLYLGTQQQNVWDSVAMKTQHKARRIRCPLGHKYTRNYRGRFCQICHTEAQRRYIERIRNNG